MDIAMFPDVFFHDRGKQFWPSVEIQANKKCVVLLTVNVLWLSKMRFPRSGKRSCRQPCNSGFPTIVGNARFPYVFFHDRGKLLWPSVEIQPNKKCSSPACMKLSGLSKMRFSTIVEKSVPATTQFPRSWKNGRDFPRSWKTEGFQMCLSMLVEKRLWPSVEIQDGMLFF